MVMTKKQKAEAIKKNRRLNILMTLVCVMVVLATFGGLFLLEKSNKSIINSTIYLKAYVQNSPYDYYKRGMDKHRLAWTASGVIVDDSGMILTAKHCLEGADYIEVVFHDGTTIETDEMYWADDADIGVAIIDPNGLYLPSADFDYSVDVGETVRAVGHPYGLLWSLTEGIVSAVKRYEPFFGEKLMIQIDAATNPGNSGGPIYDMDGDIIGIVNGDWHC
jgi:S1-C subfamily serine protease